MFEFSTNYALIFIPLFIIISVFISFIFYKKALLTAWKKYTLIVIKTLAFFFILMCSESYLNLSNFESIGFDVLNASFKSAIYHQERLKIMKIKHFIHKDVNNIK